MQDHEKLSEIIQDPYRLNKSTLAFLQKQSSKYPYCHTLQILLAKNLQEGDKLLFEKQVNKASAYSIDRKKFQRYISGRDKLIRENEETLLKSISEDVKNKESEGYSKNPVNKETQKKRNLLEIVRKRLNDIRERSNQKPSEISPVDEQNPSSLPGAMNVLPSPGSDDLIQDHENTNHEDNQLIENQEDNRSIKPDLTEQKEEVENTDEKRKVSQTQSDGRNEKNNEAAQDEKEDDFTPDKSKWGKESEEDSYTPDFEYENHVEIPSYQANETDPDDNGVTSETDKDAPELEMLSDIPDYFGHFDPGITADDEEKNRVKEAREEKEDQEDEKMSGESEDARHSDENKTVLSNTDKAETKDVEKNIENETQKEDDSDRDKSEIHKLNDEKEKHKESVKHNRPNINQLIDRFLKDEPRIRVKKDLPTKQEDLSAPSTNENPQIATETLAIVYLKQGKKDKALDIYEKLCLKFPQKSSYFAKKILQIKNELNT